MIKKTIFFNVGLEQLGDINMLYDNDIREDLCFNLEEKYGKVRFIEELVIGKARADIVMVTNYGIIGVEIKSDADTYSRLDRQVKYYDRYFDYNILAVGSTHAHHAEEHVPGHWGIVSIEETNNGIDFYWLREPVENKKVNLKNQLHLIWRREMSDIQQINHLYKYAGKSRKFVEDYLIENVEAKLLKKQMIEELFERDYSVFSDDAKI